MMKSWKRYNPISIEEKKAANRVLDSGCLSSFIGGWGDDFHGGPEIKRFENEISQYFGVKHAVTFNSLTSGLIAAVGAIGIEPGDEVIVSPWTMSATATAIVIWGGIPVFADIEKEYYGLDPEIVEQKVNENTKAIMVTDIFGHGSKLSELQSIAQKYKLKLIEDVAQAPGIPYQGKLCGTWGDIGGFSLNYHKHIHTGEGGFCITNDDDLALRMKMIRNHAEASIVNSPIENGLNMVGYNFRMGELEAAIGTEQLKKLSNLLKINQHKSNIINSILSQEPDFKVANVQHESAHAYYVLPITLLNFSKLRDKWINDLTDQGVPGLVKGYVNVHRLPMFENKLAYGKGFPWSYAKTDPDYGIGACPVVEELKDKSFVGLLISMFDINDEDCRWIATTMIDTWKALKS